MMLNLVWERRWRRPALKSLVRVQQSFQLAKVDRFR